MSAQLDDRPIVTRQMTRHVDGEPVESVSFLKVNFGYNHQQDPQSSSTSAT